MLPSGGIGPTVGYSGGSVPDLHRLPAAGERPVARPSSQNGGGELTTSADLARHFTLEKEHQIAARSRP